MLTKVCLKTKIKFELSKELNGKSFNQTTNLQLTLPLHASGKQIITFPQRKDGARKNIKLISQYLNYCEYCQHRNDER